MNKCLSLVHLITTCLLSFQVASAQTELPQARIVNLSLEPEQVVILHVRPGYVSSVRVLEEVSSVVLGDPSSFKAEHSEAEPQLVFFKATSAKAAQTNALITTKGGHEISLSLVSQGKSDHSEVVDYVIKCERPHGFLITSDHPSFVVGDTKNLSLDDPHTAAFQEKPSSQEPQLLKAQPLEHPHWEGKLLRVAVGQTTEKELQMALPFAVLNAFARTIEVLPPQIQLAVTERCNLDHNISGGVRYLAWLMRRFHNDLRLVAAAYYAGEDTIGRRGLAYRNLDVVTYVRAIRTTYLREAGAESESKNTTAKRDVR
jgi:hypothetical protein